MAAAATSAESQRPFDPAKPGRYNVRLGASLAGPGALSDHFASIAFNHKPSQTGPKRSTTIKPVESFGAPLELTIDDEEDDGEKTQCRYAGRRNSLSSSYVLTFDRERQSFQLDRMEHTYDFNMVSAPWEKDEPKLAQQYKQIEPPAEDRASPSHRVFSGSEDDEPAPESDGPKESNPFDYRHYLGGLPHTGLDSKQPSTVSTPVFGPRAGLASPASHSRPNGSTPRPTYSSPSKPSNAPASSRVHFQDHPHSSRRDHAQPDDDAGGLIIDGDSPPPAKKRRTAPPKGRPTSLHAAAEAKRAAQASSPPQQDVGSGYEEDDESDAQKEPNDDIEHLELPAPAGSGPPRPPLPRRQSTWEDGEQDDLAAALAMALSEDDEDDEPPPPPEQAANVAESRARESESESEEE